MAVSKRAHSGEQPAVDPRDERWRAILRGDGFAAVSRRLGRRAFGIVPGSPRCKVCNAPYGGPGSIPFRVLGWRPSQRTPYVCARCLERAPEGGAVAPMTVLLAEVRTYGGLIQSLPPSEVPLLLNRFYEIASRVILRHEGILGQISGEQAMGLFVPGLSGSDYSGRAVSAAAALLEAVGYGQARGAWLEVAIGVATGEGFCGNVGGGGFKDFTAVGEVPNAAERLRGRARPGDVIVDAATREQVGRFSFTAGTPIVLNPSEPAVETYRLASRSISAADEDDAVTVLLRSALFAGLPISVTTSLKGRVHRRQFEAGSVIARAGEPASTLLTVESGMVRASVTSRLGRELVLDLYTAGDCLCEAGGLDPIGTHTADLVAVEATTCVSVSRQDVLSLIRTVPELSLRLMGALAAHARRRDQELVELATLDVPGRVGRQLLHLAARHGQAVEGAVRIGFPVSQSDLAAMVGASREHVNRALSRFTRLEVLSIDRGEIVITDPDRLRSLC